MATTNQQGGAFLAPDLLRRQHEMAQAQRYGQALLEQSQQAPQAQMVSGHYVAPSITQHLARALQAYTGARTMDALPQQMADMQREQRQQSMQMFGLGGPSSSPQQGVQAFPVGQSNSQPSPQQYAQALGGQPAPSQQPSGMPLLPGRSPAESFQVFEAVGPGKYMELVAQQGAPKQPTTLMQHAGAIGLRPGTPEYERFIREGVRPPSTTVNVNSGEKAWDTESAKLFAKRYDELTNQAGAASQMIGLLDLAQTGLDSGVRTGSFGGAEQSVRQLGIALGIGDADKVAGGELLNAVTNRMALLMRSPDSGMGMPGAVSDRDLTFLKEAQIGLDRSPEGNARMLDAFRRMEQRKLEIAQMADQYVQRNGRLDAGFNQAVRDYASANPLFPELAQGQDRMRQLDQLLGF